MKLRINLQKDFFTFLFFIVLAFFLYLQYIYSIKNIIEKYKNIEYTKTAQIRDKFKYVLNSVEFIFKSKLNENLEVLKLLPSFYKNIDDFDVDKIAYLLNRRFGDNKGYYQVFVIDKSYKIIKASYKPDLGLDLGKFPKYKAIYDDMFEGRKKIDISYLIFDYSSFTLKRYFLILSPDKKYLLELAYVVDIYSKLRKLYYTLLSKYRDLEDIKLYFMDKYLIYPVNFNHHYQPKRPIEDIVKDTKNVFFKILGISEKRDIKYENLAENILKIFYAHNNLLSHLSLSNHNFITYTLIEGFFKNLSNRLIIENKFSTYLLEKDIENVRNRFIISLIALGVVFLIFRFIIFYISRTIGNLVAHMKDNKPIKRKNFFIKELDELVFNYNEYRRRLNEEILKNRELLMENKRFIIDTVHQLKTPLSIITLNSDFLKMKIEDEESKEILNEIEAAIAMLTNSYEDLAYLAANKVVEYKPSNINISHVLVDRIHFFSSLAKTRNKKIVSDIEDDIYFNINKVEFERLVDNNISNAIEYSKGEVIEVRLKRENGCIVLEFKSYGDKIKNPKKIFEKNYREKSYKRGLGIGLNIVKNICNKYNIHYEVISENGENLFKYIFCYNFNKKSENDNSL